MESFIIWKATTSQAYDIRKRLLHPGQADIHASAYRRPRIDGNMQQHINVCAKVRPHAQWLLSMELLLHRNQAAKSKA